MLFELRIPRPFYVFICMLIVFMVTQLGVDHLFVAIQSTTNEILSRSDDGLPQTISNSTNSSLTSNPITSNPIEISASSVNLTADMLTDNQIFIRSAFRVSAGEIRLTVLTDHRNKQAIFYEYSNTTGQLILTCNLPKCIEPFSPKCKIVGYIGQIFNVPEMENSTILQLRVDTLIIEVTVIDVRPKNTGYEHKLGVCVQPIYMHAEYVVFIQFFEHWISLGATKFYIYRHSYSPEVQQILDLYVKTSNASIEVVDWSDLPSRDPNFHPTRYVYRLEVMISIFDCLHRARNSVKYIAQTDLDEMVIVKDGNNGLIAYMDDLSAANPTMASASLVSRRAKLPIQFENISSPQQLDFNYFADISAESYYFPRPVYTKMIHRPERAFRVHIHKHIEADKIQGTDKKYKQVNVPTPTAYILHLRRSISSNFKLHRFTSTRMLETQAKEWNKNFHNRLSIDGNFSTTTSSIPSIQSNWQNTGLDILQKVESCRFRHENRRLKECHAVFDCDKGVNTTGWFKAENSWYLLY